MFMSRLCGYGFEAVYADKNQNIFTTEGTEFTEEVKGLLKIYIRVY